MDDVIIPDGRSTQDLHDDEELLDEADEFEDAAVAEFIRRFGSVPL
ncbi:hypothetical protein [Microbacterium caowuchunii]|nr:hypothetical protein [Microbacterium caowuchunii]